MPQSNATVTANNLLSNHLVSRAGYAFLRFMGIVPAGIFVILAAQQFTLEIEVVALATWLTCLVMYIVANVVAGPVERGLWTGYINLAVMVGWLTLGLTPALGLIVAGNVLLLPLLLTLEKSSLKRPLAQFLHLLNHLLSRSAISGLALLAAALIYWIAAGDLPLTNFEIRDLPPILLALVVGEVVALFIGWLLVNSPAQPMWANWQSLLQELLLLLLVVALPLILYNAGVFVFVIVMALVLLQAIRYRQVERYQEALARRVQELSLLNNIGQSTSANLVLDDVLLSIYRQVAQQVDATIFYIALYNEETQTLDFKLVMADGKQVKWSPRRLTEGPVEYVIRHRKPLRVVADDRLQVRELGELTQSARYLTFLGVPLLAGTKVLGIMTVLSDTSEDAFDQDDINLLETIASQTGLAVRNALLFTQSTDLVQNLSYLNESVQRVLFNPDADSALKAACETARVITRTEKVAIFLLDSEHNVFRLSHSTGLTAEHIRQCKELPYLSQSYLNGPIIVTNAPASPTYSELARVGRFHALVELPLRSGSALQGLLVVYYDRPHYHPASDLDLLGTLASQITAMLDNAEIFRMLEQYAQEMAQLVHLSQISTASMDSTTVGHDIAEILLDITVMSEVLIALIEPGDQRIRLMATAGKTSADPPQTRLEHLPELHTIQHQEHPQPHVFQTGDPALSDAMNALMAQHGAETVALLPIVAEQEMLGLVVLLSDQQRYIGYREWQFLEMATNQIAAQIRNVQLYEATQENLRQRLEQISLIEDIAKQVSSSLNFNQIIHHVLEAAMKATQADIGSLSLLTEDGDLYVIEQQHDAAADRRYVRQKREVGIIAEVIRTRQPVLVANHASHTAYVTDFPGQYHSSLAVPLFEVVENDADLPAVIGVLNVESCETAFFNEAQAAFLNSLAGHAVISIENARFLEERQHEIDMLISLRLLALWLASADDTRSVADAILETAINLLQGYEAVLFAYDGESPDILGHSWLPGREPDTTEREFALAMVQQVAASGDLTFISDVRATTRESVLAVPIRRHNRVQWVLYLTFTDQRTLQDRDLNTIDLLAGQAAGHLENATLHEQIRAGRDQMRAILDSARDGMILLDRGFRLVETNLSAQKLLGIDLDEHIGEYFPDTLLQSVEESGENGYSREEIQKTARILKLQPEAITQREFEHSNQEQTLYIQEIGAPVVDDHNRIVGRLLVLRDMTEQKELEIFRERLTRLMIHDLRSPLVTIIGGLQATQPLLSTQMTEDHVSKSRRVFDNILTSAERLSRMVDSLMDIARLENKSLSLDTRPASMDTLVSNAVSNLTAMIEQSRILVTTELPANLPLVDVDQDTIIRVIVNLLDNALRYTPAGGRILIRAKALPNKRQLQIQVADSGPGIPPQERGRIFEKFWRVPGQSPLRGHKGTGLGLSLVKAVIEAHDGTIRVDDSSPLSGACFTFTLPIAQT